MVDDDPAVTLTVARMLAAGGHRVTVSESAADALESLAREQPDAVLLDIRMPLVSGVDFLRMLRANEGAARVPVAVLTGDYFLRDEILEEIANLGALVRYKPLWMDDLTKLMDVLLDRPTPAPQSGASS